MADNSLITQEQYNEDIKRFYDEKIYPFLNGATHTGCVPLGTILPYFGETAPTHFLICDGTEYAKADYPELAEHLLALTNPTPYAGSDTNHFKVPDLRGEFLRGSGTNGHTNQGDGANVGVHQDGTEIPLIGGDANYDLWYYSKSDDKLYFENSDKQLRNIATDKGKRINSSSEATATWGHASSYTSRPTNTSVTYIIAYRNAYIDLALDSFPIDITQPTDGQLLMYDATAGRWVNGGHKYSTDEHVVGKWIDSKPIYEKTIFCGAMPNNNSKTVGHNISNLDRLISINACGKNPTSTGQIPLPYVQYNNENDIIMDSVYINTSSIILVSKTNRINITETYVTLQYTKTTDTV